ncbi:MAG TPA: deoxyribodipyrimidine photo-lyase [Candidatus Saccharimonadales bacterium]|nr:deoxyribodipyrimidine photo-lyase [Candidatus Saccharimonadales bacterium]
MTTDPPALVWFRRDLRVHDHPALVAALAEHGGVVPVFVLDEALLRGRFASANRTWFLLGSLRALDAALRERGARLHVRVGDPRSLVPALASEAGASAVYVSRDPSPYGRDRDRVVADRLSETGIAFRPKRGVLIHEPDEVLTADGTPFTVYSPFRRAWERLERRPIQPAPDAIPSLAEGRLAVGRLPSLAALGLGAEPTADRASLLEPGEVAARERLERWAARPIDDYATSRDRLDDADGTSRLSADLHLGTLSANEVADRAMGPGAGRRTFVNELVWREFYASVLFHHPSIRRTEFRPELASVPWSTDDTAVEAWRAGRTGYPVVDAGMRQLAAMGWMHNRARMVVASFLTKHLLVDWRVGEAHFMRHLIDGDVASNNGGWQWSASTGTDPQPYFRIFNPVLQGRRFDPDGDYVRRWLPELAHVPTPRVHAPWEMRPDEQQAAACVIGADYPAPIVDHAEARARALAVYEAARRTS